ncbi:MAG: PDDEXK nuclease domain-containing protein [Flavobacteriales bacterium]
MGTKKLQKKAPRKAVMKKVTTPTRRTPAKRVAPYGSVLREFSQLVEGARHASVRAVNALMTASYWEIGRRIVQHEQGGKHRAGYGEELLSRLSVDLTERFGRGFSKRNIEQMRAFHLTWPIAQTVSAQLEKGGSSGKKQIGPGRKTQTVSAQLNKTGSVDARAQQIVHLQAVSEAFPLPWSHYVRLLTVEDDKARAFYEKEALRNGWSVRQLDRQVATRFYERTGLSRNKQRMLTKGAKAEVEDAESVIRDPFMLEFLDLKDEYSESELEEALIQHLEHFLLELGGEFAFVARQRNVRIGKNWYRVDLMFFHRRLRCLVVIDLKAGRYNHADAGQMNLYLNYAQEHWMQEGENPPVGLVLCTERDDAVAHYSLNGLTNRVMAREYRITLPKEKKLEAAIEKARKKIEGRTKR